MSKVAVYRDAAGALYERSAICPHLGCVVHQEGHVVNGPAIGGLAEAKPE